MNRIARILTFIAAWGALLIAVPLANADKRPQLRDDIARLTDILRDELTRSSADKRALKEVRRHLEQALAILEVSDSGAPRPVTDTVDPAADEEREQQRYATCIEFVARGYAQTYSTAQAQDRANNDCRIPTLDLELARLLYPSYASTYSSGQAMDRAVKAASDPQLYGKHALIQYVTKAYSQNYSTGQATDRAVAQARTASPRILPCIRQNFEAYSQSYSAGQAMDRSFTVCKPPAPTR